jgi:hypothetical protein
MNDPFVVEVQTGFLEDSNDENKMENMFPNLADDHVVLTVLLWLKNKKEKEKET